MKNRVGVANWITLSRLALGPLFLLLYLTNWPGARIAGLIVAIIIEATDVADGAAARARGETSEIGKLLDPLADAVSRISYFIGFLVYGYAQAWMIAVLVYRDVGVAYMRTLAALQGKAVGRRSSGKWKGILQGTVAITILALDVFNFPWLRPYFSYIVYTLMLIVTIYTGYTLIDYLYGNRRILKELHWR
ncbi:CDP-alcohol phosphatidyltransferase family protein [bacterium]|nr:CDP-alcohol phosphatidyltransferase family protein [bacterium]